MNAKIPRSIAPVYPPRAFTFPAPKTESGIIGVIPCIGIGKCHDTEGNGVGCHMDPIREEGMEPNAAPAVISNSIIVAVIAMTMWVLRSHRVLSVQAKNM